MNKHTVAIPTNAKTPPSYPFVESVSALEGYRLLVGFSNGTLREYDVTPLMGIDIMKPLKKRAFFETAHVQCGMVVWNDDIDLDPLDIYENGVVLER